VRTRLAQLRARATSLVVASVALAIVLGAPVMAASSGSVAPAFVDALDAIGRTLTPGPEMTASSRSKVFRRTGIDVSHWQGRIAWPRVAASGIDFAIIKATEGTNVVDQWYQRNRTRARKVGIMVTAYHFAHPGLKGTGSRESRVIRDARREARFFVANADLRRDDLIPALDLERSGSLRPTELRLWTLTFLRTVRGAIGARPMVYSTSSFWRTHLSDTAKIARAGFDVFWVAHWDTNRPSVPGRKWFGQGWTFWQWTDCGRIRGIYNCVDRNTYVGSKALKSLQIRKRQVRRG